MVNTIGFEWMLVGISILCFAYAPLLTFLRAPPTKEEKKVSNGIDNGGLTLGEATHPVATSAKAGVEAGAPNGVELKDSREKDSLGGENCVTKL